MLGRVWGQRAAPRAVLTLCFPIHPCRWTAVCVAAPRPAAALPRAPAPANPGPSSRASSTTRLGSSQGPSPVRAADGRGAPGGGCEYGKLPGSHLLSSSLPGTLHPNCQDSSGRPRRDIGTILQILNDLLSATRHYQGMPQSLAQLRCQTQFSSSSSSPPASPDLTAKTTSEPLPAAAASAPLHPVVQCQSQIRMCKPSGEHGPGGRRRGWVWGHQGRCPSVGSSSYPLRWDPAVRFSPSSFPPVCWDPLHLHSRFHPWMGGQLLLPPPSPPQLVSLCTSWCRSVGSPQPAARGVGWVAVSLCPPAGLGLSLVCGGETGMQLLAYASHSQPSGLGFCRGGDGARCSGGSQCLGGGGVHTLFPPPSP